MRDEWEDRMRAAFSSLRDAGLRLCPVCVGGGRIAVRRWWWTAKREACPTCGGGGMVTLVRGQRDDVTVPR